MATDYFEQALKIAEGGRDQYEIAQIRGNLGNVALSRGDYDMALRRYYGSIEEYKKLPSALSAAARTGIVGVRMNIATALRFRGEYDLSVSTYRSVLRETQMLGLKLSFAEAISNLAEIYVVKRDYQQAAKLYRDADIYFAKVHFTPGLSAAALNIGYIDHQQSKYADADRF